MLLAGGEGVFFYYLETTIYLPLVVRTRGLLVVIIRVLTAERKPTSSSNMTSTFHQHT